jgi:hypothetical protein
MMGGGVGGWVDLQTDGLSAWLTGFLYEMDQRLNGWLAAWMDGSIFGFICGYIFT